MVMASLVMADKMGIMKVSTVSHMMVMMTTMMMTTMLRLIW